MASTSASSSEVGISRRCWNKFKGVSIPALFSPLLICFASGTLHFDAFHYYILQCIHIYKAFARAFDLAKDCTNDLDVKVTMSGYGECILEDAKMNQSLLQEYDSDLVKRSPLHFATVKYTDFLLEIALGKLEGIKAPGNLATPFEKTKVAAYTLGAITPCIRLFAFLMEELKATLDLDGKTHRYKKWIVNYSSEALKATVLEFEGLLDKLSASLTGEELNIIEKLYEQTLKLMTKFYVTQPLLQPVVAPLLTELNLAEWCLTLFSNFDSTCSVLNSSSILVELAIKKDLMPNENDSECPIIQTPFADLRNIWTILSQQYTEKYEQCVECILMTEKVERFDYEALAKAVEILSDVETKANCKVSESGIFKDINLDDIENAGFKLEFQDGCTNFFQEILKNENQDVFLHVLSYCWCADLIKAALLPVGFPGSNVHSNEFDYSHCCSTGKIIGKVESPSDKLRIYSRLIKKEKNVTVYVGYSVGDLLCLLKADIGIVFGSSSNLRRVGTHFGISFVPLLQGLVKLQKDYVVGNPSNLMSPGDVLYTASSWAEIRAFILGANMFF